MIPKHLRQKQHNLYKVFMDEKLVGMHDERKERQGNEKIAIDMHAQTWRGNFFH